MSRLSELIRDLCPDGVEYRPLGEVAVLERGTPITKKQIGTGDIPVIAGGRKPAYSHNVANREGETLVVAGSGAYAGYVSYWDRPVFVSDAFSIKVDSKILLPRFVYHWMLGGQSKVHSFKSGGGVPHVYAKDVARLLCPMPPLEVQREVVRVLDKFTMLEAELEAELEARRKQYEYYREQLMREAAICETRALIDISVTTRSGGTPRSNNASYYNGVIPWLRTQDIDFCDIWETSASITEEGLYNSSARWVPIGCVIIAMYGATAAKAAMNRIPLTMNQACCAFEIDNSKAVARYVYHWIASQYVPLRSQGEGSQNNLSVGKLKKVQVPLPSIYEQRRIADILDRFDALVNDISSGLPAEIAARRKQYEHYRDRLLLFPEKRA